MDFLGVFDVPASELIKEVAKGFEGKLEKPAWADFVKTGQHVERAPQNPDWFFVRNASVLYRVYRDGPVGTGSLRSYYGGRKNRGVKPEKKRMASGKIIRVCLQLLEKEGLIQKAKKGRIITGKGESLLVKKSKEVQEHLKHKKKEAVEVKGKEKADLAAKETREALRAQEQRARETEKKKDQKKEHKKEEKKEK
ncbi:MAG: 30S ribosomal protein S19e, small subunit ribosomal protein S19e [archaeon GW2011_AR10]|nr:MAG: 30S ribosomal protein S19e, small subunit ribosomal protein S19e [archaeon GW2011_AR10]